MLANPAANIAQHGSMNWALAGHGAVSARTSARNAVRTLCPSTQLRIVPSKFMVLVMDDSSFFFTGAAASSRGHLAAERCCWRFLSEQYSDVLGVQLPV